MLQSDASLQGWALASVSPETVAQVARTLERTRFCRIGLHSARESRLYWEVKSDGNWRPGESLNHHGETEEWELDTEF